MKIMRNVFGLVNILILTILFSGPVFSAELNDADALSGLNKGKIVFDINVKDAKTLTLYLQVIQQTHGDLIKQQIEADIILAFRGLSVKLVQNNNSPDSPEEQKLLTQLHQQVNKLKATGVKMEACSVATNLFDVPNDSIFPEIKVVGNTFVSLMGYQAQGYALIPIM